MFFIKRNKQDINETCINEVVLTYFSFLRSTPTLGNNMCGNEVSELLRYSICRLFSLETKGYSSRMHEVSKVVCNVLMPVVVKYDLLNKSSDYHKGFLEACVHCMEMSRKKAGV